MMKPRHHTRHALALASLLVHLLPAALHAEEAPPRVAVVELDPGARAQGLGEEVAVNLAELGLEVLSGEGLTAALQARQVPPPSPELASRFSPLSSIIASGVEQFFYKGNEAAIATLSPVFDLGMTHREVLARRPDYADQIYQAGIVLLRAYANTRQQDSATAVAQLLVKAFPTRHPSATTVPPKTIAVIEEHRRALEAGGTALELEPLAAEGCTAYINGGAAKEATYPVAPETPYFVTVDCGTRRAPVWRVEVMKGQRLRVPVPSAELTSLTMEGADFESRRRTEAQLRALAFWSQAAIVVGVSRDAAPKDDGLLLVRLDDGGNAQWSDGVSQRSVTMALRRVFPEYAGEVAEQAPPPTADPVDADWLGWSLVGAGALLGGGGAYLAYSAETRAAVLDCSGHDAMAPRLSGDACEGVATEPFTPEEFDANATAITTRRILGWSGVGLAAGALGYGLWRLLSTSPADGSPAVVVSPWIGGSRQPVGASVRWSL